VSRNGPRRSWAPEGPDGADTVIQDYPDGPYQRGEKPSTPLSALSDRAGRTKDGEAVVDRYAQRAGGDGREGRTERAPPISPDIVADSAPPSRTASRPPHAGAGHPGSLQPEKNGHADAASMLLTQAGKGVKDQVKHAATSARPFKSDVIYPTQVAAAGTDDQQRLTGLQALLEQQGRCRQALVPGRRVAGADPPRHRGRAADLWDALPGAGTWTRPHDTLVQEADRRAATST